MRLFLTCLLLLTRLPAVAGLGGYAGASLRLGTNARSVALGGALVADLNRGYSALANPASATYVNRAEVGLSYIALPLNRSLQSVSTTFFLPPTAAVGLSYLRAGDDQIQGRNSIGQPTGDLSYAEQFAILTFANQLTPTISVGMNAKLLLIALADEDSRGFAIDVGVLYRRSSGLSLAVRAENVTGSYSWRVAAESGEQAYVDHLPLILSGGTSLPWREFTFFAQLDLLYPRLAQDKGIALADPILIIRAAMETLVEERLFVRGGWDGSAPTLGVGLQYAIRKPADSRVDYSLLLGRGREGFGHLFTWVFGL